MKTKYLDTEIERLNLLEINNELTDWGKEMLTELKDIKQALLIPRVSNRRELLITFTEFVNKQLSVDDMFTTEWIDDFLSNCRCKEPVKCRNCDEMVVMVSEGEFCPSCYC